MSNTMTVAELREMLEYFDDDTQVYFVYNSGDYWRTHVAHSIQSVDLGMVEYSDYHQMNKVVREDDDSYEFDAGKMVLLIE